VKQEESNLQIGQTLKGKREKENEKIGDIIWYSNTNGSLAGVIKNSEEELQRSIENEQNSIKFGSAEYKFNAEDKIRYDKNSSISIENSTRCEKLNKNDKEVLNKQDWKRRLTDINSSQTTITTSWGISLAPNETGAVTVTPKDADGNIIGAGLDLSMSVSNVWSINEDSTIWVVDRDAYYVTDTSIYHMTDNNDGTYSASFSVSRAGEISVYIYSLENFEQGKITMLYYPNTVLTPPSIYNEYLQYMNKMYHSGNFPVYPTSPCSLEFYAYIKAPVTGIITFESHHDNGIDLAIDGKYIFKQFGK